MEIWNAPAISVPKGEGGMGEPLMASLDADERPIKGVHIDDPKAMFLFRWYQEIDKSLIGQSVKGLPKQGVHGLLSPSRQWGVSIRVGEQPAGHLPCPPLSSPRQEPHLQTPSSRQEDCHRSNERQKVRQRKAVNPVEITPNTPDKS